METHMEKTDGIQAQEDLAFIKKVMEDSRRTFVDDGISFIFWGILIAMALIGEYVAPFAVAWIWTICIGLGWIMTFFYARKISNRETVWTLAGKLLSHTWIACGIAMTLIGFLGIGTGAIDPLVANGLFATIMGIGCHVSGQLLGHRWVKWLAPYWWTGALIMLVWPGPYTLLLSAGMMVALEIIPGIVLYRYWKREGCSNVN